MPEIPYAGDNESIHSTTTTSFSTAYQSIHPPPRQVPRQKTVTQLTRWVSKKVSRSSMRDVPRGSQLSEQNLRQLNKAINAETEGHFLEKASTESGTASFIKEQKRTFATIGEINEINEEEYAKPNPEKERESRVRRSYAAFCEDFTLSGFPGPKRMFDMTMGMDDCAEETKQLYPSNTDPTSKSQSKSVGAMLIEHRHTIQPSFPLSSIISEHESIQTVYSGHTMEQVTTDSMKRSLNGKTEELEPQLPFTSYLHPPSPIMTPSVYKEMHRATRERKRTRKQKFLGPLRSLFLKV